MRESTVESYLREQVELYGGICEKHVSPGKRGVPDRIILWPRGDTDWVETKRPKKGAEAHQARDHERRRTLGHRVFVINTLEQVATYIEMCRQRMMRP